MSKKRVPSASGNTHAAYGVRMEYRAEVLATEKKLLLDDFASHRQWVIKELAKKNDRIAELEEELHNEDYETLRLRLEQQVIETSVECVEKLRQTARAERAEDLNKRAVYGCCEECGVVAELEAILARRCWTCANLDSHDPDPCDFYSDTFRRLMKKTDGDCSCSCWTSKEG